MSVEAWTAGPLSAPRSETTPLGNATTEYAYLTDKTVISLELEDLTTWNDIPTVGTNVSGVGRYVTSFAWDTSAASGAYLDLGRVVESVRVAVNGVRTPDVNLSDAVVELPTRC